MIYRYVLILIFKSQSVNDATLEQGRIFLVPRLPSRIFSRSERHNASINQSIRWPIYLVINPFISWFNYLWSYRPVTKTGIRQIYEQTFVQKTKQNKERSPLKNAPYSQERFFTFLATPSLFQSKNIKCFLQSILTSYNKVSRQRTAWSMAECLFFAIKYQKISDTRFSF